MKKVLCALGMSTLLAAGVVGAASTTNGAAMQAANKPAMQSTWMVWAQFNQAKNPQKLIMLVH